MKDMTSRTLSHPVRRHLIAPILAALCCPLPLQAQGIEQALSSVVRITGVRGGGTAEGTAVRGSGFVVGVERGLAVVVTSSHVIEGAKFEVAFAIDPSRSFAIPPADVIKIETQNINGLAVFRVRGALPAQLRPLGLITGEGPPIGTSFFLVGFPEMATTPRTVSRVFGGRDGQRLVIDQSVGEGFSGGPVIVDGKVVGMVTDTDNQFTYAITFVVMREFLLGSGVKLADAPVPSAGGDSGGKGTKPPGDPLPDINRRRFAVEVLGIPNSDTAIAAMQRAGYDARLYGPPGRPAEGFEVITIGAQVPARVAQELLVLSRRYLPSLRYVVLMDDRKEGASWRPLEISFGGTNRILDIFRKVTPLPPPGWQRLANAPDDETFRRVVRAYYER